MFALLSGILIELIISHFLFLVNSFCGNTAAAKYIFAFKN